jgi:hypothetical protein
VLALPGEGLKQPINERQHVDEDLLCDWIEANVLFDRPSLSGAELVDLLMEQQYYSDQAFVWQLFDILSFKLQQRARVLHDSYPLRLTHQLIERRGTWQEFLPYSFCLALSLARPFAGWAASFGCKLYRASRFIRATLSALSGSTPLPMEHSSNRLVHHRARSIERGGPTPSQLDRC